MSEQWELRITPWGCVGVCVHERSTLVGWGQGPKLAWEELPKSWAQVQMQRTTAAVWFTALLESIRNTAAWKKKIPPTFYKEQKKKKGLFFKIFFVSAGFINKPNTGFPCALERESGPSLLLLPLPAMNITSFLMSHVCGQAKGTVKIQESIHSQIQRAKKNSFSRKPFAAKKTFLLQAPA